jgi:hypothetical protein
MPRGSPLRTLGFALAGMLFSVTALRAQVQVGSETQLNLDGSISAGYSGSMTNEGPDSHGLLFGGIGNFSGSYHSPQFLSFDVAPYFNQSRDNSGYQSLTNSSGVSASANIFGGSQFPGYISFTKSYNSQSNYAVPGLANYATNGNTDTLGVGWSAHFKDLPSLTFGYQQGSSDFSLYGTQQDSFNNFHSVFGIATYAVDGFHMSGGIRHSSGDSLFPVIEAGEIPERASTDSTTYTFNMSRSIAWEGSTWFNFTRNSTGYDALGMTSSQTSDLLAGGLAVRPTAKLNAQVSFDYNDNLAGTIFQEVTGSGALAPVSIASTPSHSWGVVGSAQYSLLPGLYVAGNLSYRQQLFLGESFNSTAYGVSVNYGHKLWGGQLTAGATVTHNTYASNNGSTLGLLTNVIYVRRFGPWGVNGSFGYSQNVQSILIAYTTSGYSYSLSANRRIGRLMWTGGANGAKSVLTETQGPNYLTQGYSTGLSGRWLGVGFGYSKSSGNGLITPTGIIVTPPGVPPPLLATVLYGGTSYSGSIGSTPVRGLTFSGTYVSARSNTENGSLSSSNKTDQAYAYLTYRFRKVYFNAGYSRLLQGFSASGLTPTTVSSYYFGVSRWFKVF